MHLTRGSDGGYAGPGILYGTAWKQQDTARLVTLAIRQGFRGIDTACQPRHYDEAGVGAGVAAALGGALIRSELYLQTKFTPVSGQDPTQTPYDPTAPTVQCRRREAAMFLFTRRTRLVGGNGSAGLDWATAVTTKVNQITGHDVQLWAGAYSPSFGTITWTAWFEDLTALETLGDKLQADPGFVTLTNEGEKLTDGTLDDALYQPVHGQPDPSRQVQYVGAVQAVLAAGNYARGLAAGVEIAQAAEKVTGIPTIFSSGLTGSYGSVGFVTGYETIAALEQAQAKLASDAGWIKLIDSTKGCFVEDAASTQQTIHRRVV